jgi:hypothetical protein
LRRGGAPHHPKNEKNFSGPFPPLQGWDGFLGFAGL